MTADEREAQRRVDEAVDLIRSAYRLADLDPRDTVSAVRLAIAEGASAHASDVAQAAASA